MDRSNEVDIGCAADVSTLEEASRGALRPFLLDRLTDDWLTRHSAEELDSAQSFNLVMSGEKYRETVIRDLRWLLNTTSAPVSAGRRDHTLVADSVLNYGLPDFSRLNLADVRGTRFSNMVKRAIQRFEPRILATSLSVRIVSGGPSALVSIVIEGTLWALPVPEHLRVQGELDSAGGRQWAYPGAVTREM